VKAYVPWAAAAVLAVTALLLWLNLRERDLYAYALPGPPAGPVNQSSPPSWLPPVDEITENLLWARIDDVDGWYRVFWAGTDVYWFDDASYFAGALKNRTATNPTGRYRIAGRHKEAPFRLVYVLPEAAPPDGEAEVAGLTVPLGVHWFTSEYWNGRRTFSWILERP